MYKSLADSTLMRMNKKQIIEQLRIAEYNFKVTEASLNIGKLKPQNLLEKNLQWHFIKDELPEIHELVLIQVHDEYMYMVAQLDEDEGIKKFISYSNVYYGSWDIEEVLRWAYVDLKECLK